MNHSRKYKLIKDKLESKKQINNNILAKNILKIENIITLIDTKEIYAYNENTGL